MGNISKKSAAKKYKLYKENNPINNNYTYEWKSRNKKEYEEFKSKYRFVTGNEIRVDTYEVFAVESNYNHTIPQDEDRKKLIEVQPPLEIVMRRSFYPYDKDICGGDTYYIFVLRGTVPGNYTFLVEGVTKKVIVKE